jgi:hypothetical protein
MTKRKSAFGWSLLRQTLTINLNSTGAKPPHGVKRFSLSSVAPKRLSKSPRMSGVHNAQGHSRRRVPYPDDISSIWSQRARACAKPSSNTRASKDVVARANAIMPPHRFGTPRRVKSMGINWARGWCTNAWGCVCHMKASLNYSPNSSRSTFRSPSPCAF